MQYPNSNRFKQEDVYFNIFISIDRSQLSSIPNTDTWLIYEEDKKQVTKLDGLLPQIDYRHNRVGILCQQPQATVNDVTECL